jgi:RNA polymerase-binding transcription factor DksA
MRKGLQIATLLSDVLAGKDKVKELATLKLAPGIRPEEALRMYLALIEGKRALLDAGDDRFGRCEGCGIDLGESALREMPWADRCPRCAS